MRKRLWLWGIVLAVLMLTVWVQFEREPSNGTHPFEADVSKKVDYYLENFKITQLNELGQPNYSLSGHKLIHYRDTDTADVIDPTLFVTGKDASQWKIVAERAWISKNNEYIHLLGKVDIQRQEKKSNPGLSIMTSNLKIRTQDHFAETDDPVVLQSVSWHAEANGLSANLTTGQFSLLSNVKGMYSDVIK
ncbi:MAG: LPS export ABC transporter periplasmic protein LptC [Gammaproteobacteria bacterium]|nr:LPS export ABC transporter periplasmic protein LptC [Gammaproteobacteria bacterium]